MPKSPDAFRTISEVADWLGLQAHVLRFWESKFTQVKPIKRAGGRRYYRPSDMLLLGGIKKLLHDDGLTIKGAQKLIREKGVAYVSDLSQPLDDLTVAVIEGAAEDVTEEAFTPDPTDALAETEDAKVADAPNLAAAETEESLSGAQASEDTLATQPVDEEPISELEAAPEEPDLVSETDETGDDAESEPAGDIPVMPSFRAHARSDMQPEDEPQDERQTDAQRDDPPEAEYEPAAAKPEKLLVTPPKPEDKSTRKPRVIDVGPLPELTDFPNEPAILSSVSRVTSLTADEAEQIRPLLARLTRLRASMANPRKDASKD